MEAMHQILWKVVTCFMLLTTARSILSCHSESSNRSSLQTSVTPRNVKKLASFLNSKKLSFTCKFNSSCLSAWITQPQCENGFLQTSESGFIKISIHYQPQAMNRSSLIYWMRVTDVSYVKEISRCRYLSSCWVRVATINYSATTKVWLDVLFILDKGSLIGEISFAICKRIPERKSHMSLNNTIRSSQNLLARLTNTVVQKNEIHTTLEMMNMGSRLQQEKEMIINNFYKDSTLVSASRHKHAADKTHGADDQQQQAENPEEDYISDINNTDYVLSGDQNDPAVETDELESSDYMIPENLLKLRRLIKLKELEEAEAMSQLEEAKTNHAVRVALGEDVRNSSAVRIKAEDKVEHLEENLSKLKSEYEEAFRGTGMASVRKLQALVVINAIWGDWSSWSKCSSECGKGGFTIRRRDCKTHPDVPCHGTNFDVKACNVGVKCTAKFNDWGVWGPCSVTCGKGVRARSRVCISTKKELKCSGLSSLLEICIMPKCEPPKPSTASPLGAAAFPFAVNPNAAVGVHPFPLSSYRQFGPSALGTYVSAAQFPPIYYGPHRFSSAYRGTNVAPFPSAYYRPPSYFKPARRRLLLKNLIVPTPPVKTDSKYQEKKFFRRSPFVWGTWGEWSDCSSPCGEGQRARERLCIDISQEFPVKEIRRFCGTGSYSQILNCIGPCRKAAGDEDGMPSRVRVMETGGKKGPYVITHHRKDQGLKILRAQVVETIRGGGPRVITEHDEEIASSREEKGPLSKVEVVETGDRRGPSVIIEHEPATGGEGVTQVIFKPKAVNMTKAEKHKGGFELLGEELHDLKLTAKTIVFIVAFLLCVVLLITAFSVYFYQKAKEARIQKKLKSTRSIYKKNVGDDDDDDDEDLGQLPPGGVVRPVVR